MHFLKTKEQSFAFYLNLNKYIININLTDIFSLFYPSFLLLSLSSNLSYFYFYFIVINFFLTYVFLSVLRSARRLASGPSLLRRFD